jgi:hypothetical protein
LQQSDHRRDDPAFLDEVDLALEGGGRVAVEADDEPGLDLEARPLDAAHVLHQVALEVLLLAALGQAVLLRRLDPDEHGREPGPRHQVEQFRVVGQIDRNLGVEGDAGLVLPPNDQAGSRSCLR